MEISENIVMDRLKSEDNIILIQLGAYGTSIRCFDQIAQNELDAYATCLRSPNSPEGMGRYKLHKQLALRAPRSI